MTTEIKIYTIHEVKIKCIDTKGLNESQSSVLSVQMVVALLCLTALESLGLIFSVCNIGVIKCVIQCARKLCSPK